VPKVPDKRTPSLDDIVADFTLRLRDLVDLAAREHGEMLIASIFSRVNTGPRKRADGARRKLLAALTRQFFRDVERMHRARVRKALDRESARRERAAKRAVTASGQTAAAPRPRRGRRRPLPPPLAPEQIQRDAEFARLRALLRPAAEHPHPPVPAPELATPSLPAPRPATPADLLRALEKEIQNAVPTLGTLGPERCGAQIAAWSGQVRQLRDRLSPEVLAVMRPALRIFLEHLTELRAAMEAHFVDALEPQWSAPDWGVYVEVNRARAEGRSPELSPEQIELHHRAMLRTLVLPHRRNVPVQAIPVINAAAEVLSTDDSQVRSAVRRLNSERRGKTEPEVEAVPSAPTTEAPPTDTIAATAAPVDEILEPDPGEATPATAEAPVPAAEELAIADAEFEHPWTK